MNIAFACKAIGRQLPTSDENPEVMQVKRDDVLHNNNLKSSKSILYGVAYDVIVDIMEPFGGYTNSVNRKTGNFSEKYCNLQKPML